jgi:hypothetical protein
MPAREANDRREFLATVHGINSDGEWQEAVERILGHHFQCEHFKYRTFRYSGALLIFLGPWALLAGLACLAALGGMRLDESSFPEWWALPLAGLVALGTWAGQKIPPAQKLMALLKTWLWPLVLVLVAVSLGLAAGRWSRAFVAVWPVTYTWAGAAVLALGLAVAEAVGRRRRQAARLATWFRPRARAAPASHIIAHSLGTYLVGTVLLENLPRAGQKGAIDEVRRIVLVGSVLPTNFEWAGLALVEPAVFEQVRSEAGGRDWVVGLAGLVQRCVPRVGIGDAGRRGFAGPPALVHTIDDNPLDDCDLCPTPEEKSKRRLHNVRLATFFHSDAFLGPGHAEKFWLPFLWGLDPWEYWDFRRLCNQAESYARQRAKHRAEQVEWEEVYDGGKITHEKYTESFTDATRKIEEAAKRREIVLRQLNERVWSWVEGRGEEGMTFAQFVAFQVAYRAAGSVTPEELKVWTARALRKVPELVVRAQEQQGSADPPNTLVRMLHPYDAVMVAISRVM